MIVFDAAIKKGTGAITKITEVKGLGTQKVVAFTGDELRKIGPNGSFFDFL